MPLRFVVLRHSDKEAWIYPEQGMQLYKFKQTIRGQEVEMIHAPSLDREPADRRFGNPILFPAPSLSTSDRAPDSWIWQDHLLPMSSHGIARNFYWHPVEVTENRVTSELVPNGSAKASFPFEFRLRCTYTLDDRGLVLDMKVENGGKEAFPYALGFHPYLRTPLGPLGARKDCVIRLPGGIQMTSADRWKTLQGHPVREKEIQADEELAGSILITESKCRSMEVQDRANGLAIRVSVESSVMDFPYWVIWSASPNAPFVCLEPWTDGPNALNRRETRRCEPGARHEYQMILSLRDMGDLKK